MSNYRSDELLPYQREFVAARDRYALMLAHRRAGKTRAAITAALNSGRREFYVCASEYLRDEALALAQELADIRADGLTLILPSGGVLTIVDASDPLRGAEGNVTLDEPHNPDAFVAALCVTRNGYRIRVVCSAFNRGSLIQQLCDGALFKIYKTDINRSSAQGFPWHPDWASDLERGCALYRQEYLCEHSPQEQERPAMLWYSVLYTLPPTRAVHRVHVPGISRKDAERVFNAYPRRPPGHESARLCGSELSNTPIACEDCGGAEAIWHLDGLPGKYCLPHAQERMQAGVDGHSLYVLPPAAPALRASGKAA